MFKVSILRDLVTNLALLVSVLNTIDVMLKSDQLTWPVPHKLYECSRKQRTLLWVAHSIMVGNIGITWHNEASGRNTILHQSQRTSIRTLGLIEENSRFNNLDWSCSRSVQFTQIQCLLMWSLIATQKTSEQDGNWHIQQHWQGIV